MAFVPVAEIADLVEGVPHLVTVENKEVGVILWQDQVFAVLNICPHQLAPVCLGFTMPMIVSDDLGAFSVDATRPVLLCPWHQWEFDIRTGETVVGESSHHLKTYPTMLEEGKVLVNVGKEP